MCKPVGMATGFRNQWRWDSWGGRLAASTSGAWTVEGGDRIPEAAALGRGWRYGAPGGNDVAAAPPQPPVTPPVVEVQPERPVTDDADVSPPPAASKARASTSRASTTSNVASPSSRTGRIVIAVILICLAFAAYDWLGGRRRREND